MIKNKDIENYITEAKQGYYLIDDEILESEGEFFPEYYNEVIDEIIKDYSAYLVVSYNGNWRGSTGYKITTYKLDAFSRTYDYTQELISVSKGNKTCLLREYHHDRPTGHEVRIIGLTDRENEKLMYTDFETIIKFADNYR